MSLTRLVVRPRSLLVARTLLALDRTVSIGQEASCVPLQRRGARRARARRRRLLGWIFGASLVLWPAVAQHISTPGPS